MFQLGTRIVFAVFSIIYNQRQRWWFSSQTKNILTIYKDFTIIFTTNYKIYNTSKSYGTFSARSKLYVNVDVN